MVAENDARVVRHHQLVEGIRALPHVGADHDAAFGLERAHGGVILFREIGALSEQNQLLVLQILDTMEFTRLGDSTPIRIDLRVLAATSQDLHRAVAEVVDPQRDALAEAAWFASELDDRGFGVVDDVRAVVGQARGVDADGDAAAAHDAHVALDPGQPGLRQHADPVAPRHAQRDQLARGLIPARHAFSRRRALGDFRGVVQAVGDQVVNEAKLLLQQPARVDFFPTTLNPQERVGDVLDIHLTGAATVMTLPLIRATGAARIPRVGSVEVDGAALTAGLGAALISAITSSMLR